MLGHNSPPLLATKLHIPPARPGLVVRERLLARMEESLRHRLTLIAAEPGAGKTTLVSAWSTRQQARLGWLSLDESDNDPVRFWRYVVAALQTVLPGVGQPALKLLSNEWERAISEKFVTALVNELLERPSPDFGLVLDDYQFIELESIHASVAFWLDHLPGHMHLLITTRTEPPLPLTRWRVRGQVLEIRGPELRFSPEEAEAFFIQTMPLPLTRWQVEVLQHRTEGWVAGLQLAGLTLRGRNDASDFIGNFSGNQRLVLDYLGEEVLTRQSEPVRQFLLQTAVLHRLSGGLVEAVGGLGPGEGQARLEQLERSNLFVIPLDEQSRWYRYHPLFAGFLRHRLAQSGAGAVADLHRRAAEWYEQHDYPRDALDHRLAAGDYYAAARLLEPLVLPLIHSGESRTVQRWFELLPASVIETSPSLCLVYASALFNLSRFDELERPLQLAEAAWQTGAGEDGPAGEQVRLGLARTAVLRAHLSWARGQYRPCIDYARQALALFDLLPEPEGGGQIGVNLAGLALGSGLLATGALGEARPWLGRGLNSIAALHSQNQQAEYYRNQGQLARAVEQSLAVVAQTENGTNLWQRGVARIRLAEIYREWAEFAQAEECLNEALQNGESYGLKIYRPAAYLVLARLRWSQGQPGAAYEVLSRVEQEARNLNNLYRREQAAALEARFKLGEGEIEAAGRWAARFGATHRLEMFSFEQEVEWLIYGRVLTGQGQSEQALEVLSQLEAQAQRQERDGSLVEIYMLQSLAHQALGQPQQARATFLRSLALGAAGSYTRLYIEEGAPMRRLLLAHQGHLHHSRYVLRLLEGLEAFRPGPGPSGPLQHLASARPAPALAEPLSEREQEVLQLIAAGLSNKDIAARLYLSMATVKTHINHLYAKLEAENRVQALLRARELHLL